ncbi:MAG: ABC transporter ATP-binding protein [Rhizobiaceae bacterium]|nr:ABC transporter ATP-binding protein [Rhizobiaceae bacterium]
MTALLEIDGLSVTYDGGIRALDAVSLHVRPGERVGLIGESGSGKSTLALAIARLLPRTAQTAGSIFWKQADLPPRNGIDIGYVFQDPTGSLDPLIRVGDQLAEVVRVLRGLSRHESRNVALGLLSRVALPDAALMAARYPHQLSGGQKQRVAIACALAGRPGLLIADEATSALDTIVQAGIVGLLNRLNREERLSLLFVTHDLALASTLADRLYVLRDGRVVESGASREIVETPRDPYVAGLVRSHLALDGPSLLPDRDGSRA